MKKSIDSAVFLAVCTAVLYSWSTANYHGFLITAKLNPDMMERSFHQIIYSGLLVSFAPIFLMLTLASFVLFSWSHAILPAYIDWVRSSFRSKRRVIKMRRYWIGKRISTAVEKQGKIRFNYTAIFSLAALAFICSLVYFENKGEKDAKEIIAKHMNNEKNLTSMVTASINDNKKTLRFLRCGAKNCAGIEVESNIIYYFSQDSGYSFSFLPETQ